MRPKPTVFSAYSNVPLDTVLVDKRSRKFGIVFGKVEDLCRQLGIEYEEMGHYTRFYAPKSRLQIFVEKLHFSKTYYSFQPF